MTTTLRGNKLININKINIGILKKIDKSEKIS